MIRRWPGLYEAYKGLIAGYKGIRANGIPTAVPQILQLVCLVIALACFGSRAAHAAGCMLPVYLLPDCSNTSVCVARLYFGLAEIWWKSRRFFQQ